MYVDQRFTLLPATLGAIEGLLPLLDIAPGPGGSRFSDYTKTTKILGPMIDHRDIFRPLQRLAVVALYPSSQIVGHRDYFDVGVRPTKRYHIPLQTNDRCWVFHDGDWQQLEVGRIYQMDPGKVHGAVNWGETVRLHLLVDV